MREPLTYNGRVGVFRLAGYTHNDPYQIIEILELGEENFYSTRYRRKRSGGVRRYFAPHKILKEIQRRINRYIIGRIPPPKEAHGYVRGRSIFTNAVPHLQACSYIHIDLSGAFDSVGFRKFLVEKKGWLYYKEAADFFGIKEDAAKVMHRLVDIPGRKFFGQGPPTSPALFNLSIANIYRRLVLLANNVQKHIIKVKIEEREKASGRTLKRSEKTTIRRTVKVALTGYADNFVFSTTEPYINEKVVNAVYRIFSDNQVLINHKKSFVIFNANHPNNPIRLPGLNIINGEISLRQKLVRKFRQQLFLAGKKSDYQTKAGIEGYVIQVYGELPPQLKGIYQRGYNSTHPLVESVADGL